MLYRRTISVSRSKSVRFLTLAAFDVENGVCLQAVSMMSVDVYARNRGYGSTIGTNSPRPLTVGVRIGRARIQ